jgi:two-component system response regulator AlgR
MNLKALNIAIADDEPLARLRLQQLCEDLHETCPNTVMAHYEHGSALVNAMSTWSKGLCPDVILLDINMPGLSGVEIAAYLKQHAPQVSVIFVTAEPQHALAAFEVAALDYVLKPVRTERLLAALRKLPSKSPLVTQTNRPSSVASIVLAVHDGTSTLSLSLEDVLYFKSNSKTTLVRTRNASYTSTQSLADLETGLAANGQVFVRIHRNALLRREAAGPILNLDTVQVIGVGDTLQVSRRMLSVLRTAA